MPRNPTAEILKGNLEIQQWRERARSREGLKHCTFPSGYSPMPGGQTEFWNLVPLILDPESLPPLPRVVWVVGGIGSGKSHVGSAFVCSRALLDPKSRGLISANSYNQLETSTLVALVEFCESFNIPLAPKRETVEETASAIARAKRCQIFNAQVLVLSSEIFTGQTSNSKERGRGLQIRYFWADEWAYAGESSFTALNGRLGRGGGWLPGMGVVTSSPNRNNPKNWAYKLFISENRSLETKSLYQSVNCVTRDNSSLDDDYISSLIANFDPILAAIELEGKFLTQAAGRIASYFNSVGMVRSDLELDSTLPVLIGLDFNFSPSVCIYAQEVEGKLHVIQEEFHLDCGTISLSQKICARLERLWPNPMFRQHKVVVLFGDATGQNRAASSQKTNWSIIKEAIAALGVKIVRRYKDVNPSVIDSCNSLNQFIFQNRLVVDASCKNMLDDLDLVCWKEDGSGIDKKDLMRSHLFDCLRYLVHELYPVQATLVKMAELAKRKVTGRGRVNPLLGPNDAGEKVPANQFKLPYAANPSDLYDLR